MPTALLVVALTAGSACGEPTSGTHGRTDAGTTAPAPAPELGTGDHVAMPIRRLTPIAYDNTIRDLLGTKTTFSAAYPVDVTEPAPTNVASDLVLPEAIVAFHARAARQLAAEAMRNPEIVTCDARQLGREACATKILARLVARAWRRPVASDELAPLLAQARDAETFEQGLEGAIASVLVSKELLFRIERDADPTDSTPHRLTEHELAARLSYFLWASMPDDVLFAFADAGILHEPPVFEAQVKRMLADPRARGLADDLASEWLIAGLPRAAPSPVAFATFDAELRASMANETRAVLDAFLSEDRSFLDIVDAPFTFVDARLAAHYGIPGVIGTQVVRVPLWPATHRGGLLTHASVLTSTSTAERTVPFARGAWVQRELWCSTPDERTEQLGAALEHFDAVGRWRELDGGTPVDGAGALAARVKGDPRFPSCVARRLLAFANGRSPAAQDEAEVAELTATFARGGHRLRDLVVAIVHHDGFRTRHGGSR